MSSLLAATASVVPWEGNQKENKYSESLFSITFFFYYLFFKGTILYKKTFGVYENLTAFRNYFNKQDTRTSDE